MSNTIPQRHPVRNAVCATSTGEYYDEVSHWWDAVCCALQVHGFEPVSGAPPTIYNNEGRGRMALQNTDTELAYTWYRMPSFRWEIVCHLT